MSHDFHIATEVSNRLYIATVAFDRITVDRQVTIGS